MSTPLATAIVPTLNADGRFDDEFAPLSVAADKEIVLAARLDAVTAAGNAAASAGEALQSALDSAGSSESSDGFRDLAQLAAAAASAGAVAAEAAAAAAQTILENIAADRGVPGGLATLDESGRLPSAMLPTSALEYLGTWDAATNTPTLTDAVGDVGDMYRVTSSAVRDLGSGLIDWNSGDYAIHNGDHWEKADGTDAVQSVAGRVGAIILTKADVGLGNVDNTSDANKPVSTATQTEINKTVSGGQVVGDNLVLTKVGGGQEVAGNVRGLQGLPGDLSISVAAAGVSGAQDVNASLLPSTRRWTLGGNVTVGVGAAPSGERSGTVTYRIVQPATGGPFTVTWHAAILWLGGAPAPVMPTAPGSGYVVHLFWTGSQWLGAFAGNLFP